jgi:catalase
MYPKKNPAPLTMSAILFRFGAIGIVLLVAVGLFAFTAGWLSPHRPDQTAFIAAMEAANGRHPGFRRNHSKGVCVSGYFDPAPEAAQLSKAALFRQQHVPLVGRFALAGGMPQVADTFANVRSFALRFQPTAAAEWRTGMNDIPVFVADTVESFYEQQLVAVPDPHTGKPDPDAMPRYLARHPETARAFGLIKARPVSSGFANDTYNSLNAFLLVDEAGKSRAVRWAAVAVQPFAPADAGPRADDNKNFLFDDLIAATRHQPLSWHLVFTLAEPGDPTADSTLAWPAGRRQVDAGLLTIERAVAEDGGACNDVNYDPMVLPPGIEASDDPILAGRSAVYARSFTLRSAEKHDKPPSAVSAAEVKGANP